MRAYAGVSLDSFEAAEGQFVFVRDIDPEGPLAEAGLLVVDGDVLLRRVDGEEVRTAKETFAVIERKQPGETVLVKFERMLPPIPDDGSLPAREPFSLPVTLAEEPLLDDYTFRFWARPTALPWDDQARIGLYLSEVSRPLADYYGLDSARGVVVRQIGALMMWIDRDATIQHGDVLMAFAGQRVDSMPELQTVVDRTPEDRPITMRFLRGDDEYEFRLPRIGPNVPGANHLPLGARDRVAAAIERVDLHQDHFSVLWNYFRTRDPRVGESAVLIGAIRHVDASSIAIELLGTGNEWSLRIDSETMVGGRGASTLNDLRPGLFVEVRTQDGETAFWIFSKAEPLR